MEEIVRRLLEWSKTQMNWYRFTYRREPDPFRKLCITILLQRSRAEQVDKVYGKLFSRFPAVRDLARANVEELTRVIRGVGLHRQKARILKQVAQAVLLKHRGSLPKTRRELLELPGVGEYTADIISSLVLGENVIAVDVNVVRPLQRMGLIKKSEEAKPFLERLIPKKYWRSFNRILLEFGMSVCKPAKPLCELCPLIDLCLYPQKPTTST